jgi:hypothetical protein
VGWAGFGRTAIGYAESEDGVEWERHPSPVVEKGQAGDWGDCFVDGPRVVRRLRDGAAVYEMWCQAASRVDDCDEWYVLRFETADPEGIEGWTRSPDGPVLRGDPFAWDSARVAAGPVLFDATAPPGKKYRMWYQGYNEASQMWRVGLAESDDGVGWQKYPGPVLVPEAPEEHPKSRAILLRENVLEMWYTARRGAAWHISYATSLDGIHWTKWARNPVLSPTEKWEGDSVAGCWVIMEDGPELLDGEGAVYKLWYTGMASPDAGWHIGYAEAPWTVPLVHFAATPVASAGGLAILFDASTTVVPEGTVISSYAWEFGDGRSGVGRTVVHPYAQEGDYLAGVTVTYDGDGQHGGSLEVKVTSSPMPLFRRGDCNDDGGVDISDAVCILSWLFLGGPAPGSGPEPGSGSGCSAVADTNGNGSADISDAVYLLDYLFKGGPEPVAPFPDCGPGSLPADQGMCETPPANCRQ